MKMKARPTKWIVYPEGNDNKLYSERVTYIERLDESGGEFVEVTQDGNSIRIDTDEWPAIWNTIATAIKDIVENEN